MRKFLLFFLAICMNAGANAQIIDLGHMWVSTAISDPSPVGQRDNLVLTGDATSSFEWTCHRIVLRNPQFSTPYLLMVHDFYCYAIKDFTRNLSSVTEVDLKVDVTQTTEKRDNATVEVFQLNDVLMQVPGESVPRSMTDFGHATRIDPVTQITSCS